MLSNKTYDIINAIAKYVLPLLSTMLLNINNKLQFADNDIISLIIIEIIAFLNGLLGISSLWYYKKEGNDEVEETKAFPFIPSINSKYFIMGNREGTRPGYDGYSPCIAGNKQLYPNSTLNNCVGGAWGLFAMYLNNPNCKIGFITSSTYPQGAGSWFNNGKGSKWDRYLRGKEPKIGSVICYENHVAFVNEVKQNGDIVVYTSSYDSSNIKGIWEFTLYKSNNYTWNNYTGNFQGFIYPEIQD